MWEIVELGSRRYEDQKEITLASRSRFLFRKASALQGEAEGYWRLTICTRH